MPHTKDLDTLLAEARDNWFGTPRDLTTREGLLADLEAEKRYDAVWSAVHARRIERVKEALSR